MIFGRCLQDVMDDKGIKQEELAEGIGKKQATISGYVNSKIDPSLSVVEKIAEFLGMTTSELLNYKKETVEDE